MKLPNKFGNVSKLSGNRRKPYRARVTVGWEDGKQIFKTIGYFETKEDGIIALSEYHKNPYNIDNNKFTFAEIYQRWSEKKFKEISQSNINGYRASYKLCSSLYDMKMTDIRLLHLQSVVDNSGKNYPILKKLKIMFNQLFDYAVQNEIIGKDKHIVEYLNIGKPQKSDKHYRFTEAEINTMWNWSENNEYIQVILMLIYTGVRPGELFAVKSDSVNLDEQSFYIDKGKNNNAVRKVPIHNKILPFFKHWKDKNTDYLITQLNGKPILFATNHQQYTDTYWYPLLADMGILKYTNDKGDIKEHTPDDTRHTFTTIWREKKLDEAMRRKIQGHSGKGIGEIVYTHFEFESLKAELNKL